MTRGFDSVWHYGVVRKLDAGGILLNLKSHLACEGLSARFQLSWFVSSTPQQQLPHTITPSPYHGNACDRDFTITKVFEETSLDVATCSVLPWRSLAALVLRALEHARATQAMPENLKSLGLGVTKAHLNDDINQEENLRLLSRSPHPYHRQKWELLEPSDRVVGRAVSTLSPHNSDDVREQILPVPGFAKDSSAGTDSGTEADDENYVKRLPAPRARLHKGLRGRPEALSGSGTPVLTPTTAECDLDGFTLRNKGISKEDQKKRLANNAKRKKEVIRRGAEVLILSALGRLVFSNPTVRSFVAACRNGELACNILPTHVR